MPAATDAVLATAAWRESTPSDGPASVFAQERCAIAAVITPARRGPTPSGGASAVLAASRRSVPEEASSAGSVSLHMLGLVLMFRAPQKAFSLDAESRAWLEELRSQGARRERALARLHALLVRAARYQVNRRRASFGHLDESECDALVQQSADDALMAILGKLEDYRGDSRFTTWAYKFALLEAGVKLRRRAWQGRELPLEDAGISALEGMQAQPQRDAETRELISALKAAIEEELTPRQRTVLVAIALNGVPIDVLAERLGSTRGALYKTLHDARQRLRARLAAEGHPVEPPRGYSP